MLDIERAKKNRQNDRKMSLEELQLIIQDAWRVRTSSEQFFCEEDLYREDIDFDSSIFPDRPDSDQRPNSRRRIRRPDKSINPKDISYEEL